MLSTRVGRVHKLSATKGEQQHAFLLSQHYVVYYCSVTVVQNPHDPADTHQDQKQGKTGSCNSSDAKQVQLLTIRAQVVVSGYFLILTLCDRVNYSARCFVHVHRTLYWGFIIIQVLCSCTIVLFSCRSITDKHIV